MPALSIRVYPDPILRRKALPIHKLTPKVIALAHDLVGAMRAAPHTIGLAAPQIGLSLRLIAVDVSAKEQGNGMVVLVNPSVTEGRGGKIVREGCLSLPDYTGNVRRYEEVTVEGLDLKGAAVRISARGLEAVCLQHEIDHLDGILFIDRVESLATDIFRRKRYFSC